MLWISTSIAIGRYVQENDKIKDYPTKLSNFDIKGPVSSPHASLALPWLIAIGFLNFTNTCILFQLGDVELTKAWLADLATLGHKLPQFDQPAKEEEQSCAEQVAC